MNLLVSTFKGPIIITALYMMLWYYLLFFVQIKTKYRLVAKYRKQGQKFDRYFGNDEEMLAADRSVANTNEQMIPFLLGLWGYAVFISPSTASYLGLVYVLLRSFYPVLLGRRITRLQSRKVAYVTVPCYLIVFYLLGSVLAKAVFL